MKNRSQQVRMDAPTIVLHWVLVISLILSLITGFRIASDDPSSQWMLFFDAVLLQGEVTYIHIVSATILSFVAVAYVVFMFRSGLSSRIRLDRYRLAGLQSRDKEIKLSALNVLMFWFVYLLLGAAAITGVMLYVDSSIAPITTRNIHEIIAWSVFLYVFVHVFVQIAFGGVPQLLKILTPRAAYGATFLVALTVSSATAGTMYVLDKLAVNELRVPKMISDRPVIDGDINDTAWARVAESSIQTSRGANVSGQEVSVSVKAVHDGDYFYALFKWPDSSRSQKHLPLVKTESGWRVMQSEYHIQDEDDYYEDKFGVMLSHVNAMAGAGTAHMGNKPLENRPSPSGGRGLHYTTDDSIVDVWHWKSVRSGSAMMNQIDDNYFGPPMEAKPGKSRYTGGYTKDPKSAGGFSMNWEKFAVDTITPKRLPKDPDLIERFQNVDLSPGVGDDVALYMSLNETVPYDPSLDNYPVGTIMPSVLIDAPFVGDRGDVTAVSRWHNGYWHMEVKRKLDTGSQYDVALTKERPAYMWVAVFDHAQTRHSQHMQPLRVIVE